MKGIVAFILASLFASPAFAGWTSCPGSTSDTGTAAAKVTPASREICLRQTTATDPARVDARACREGVDVIFNADIAGTNTTATAYPYQCPATGSAGTFTDCEKIMVDRTGDNVVDDQAMNGAPASSRDATYGIAPGWLAFDIENGSSHTIELRLICR